MTPLKFTCPKCRSPFTAPGGVATVACPKCQARFNLSPAAKKAAATAPPQKTSPSAASPVAAPYAPSPAGTTNGEAAQEPQAGARPKNTAAKVVLGGILGFFVLGAACFIYLLSFMMQESPKSQADEQQQAKAEEPAAKGPERSRTETSSSGETQEAGANDPPAGERNARKQDDPPDQPKREPKRADEDRPRPAPEPDRVVQAPPPAASSLPPEKQKKVNEAVDRGTEYLKKSFPNFLPNQQRPPQYRFDPYQEGAAALIGLTLLECGVPPEEPNMQKAAAYLRTQAPRMEKTYCLSTSILFLDRLGDPRNRDLIQTFALRLVAGQQGSGAWHYDCRNKLTPEEEGQLLKYLDAVKYANSGKGKLDAANALPDRLRQLPVAQAQPERGDLGQFGTDNSNTQFALLALWVAQRHGLPMQPALKLVDQYFRDTQDSDGSWSYGIRNRQFRYSMTSAGLLGVAVGRGLNVKIDGEQVKDESIAKGLRYLGTTIQSPSPNSEGKLIRAEAHGDLYYLWCLERVAMVYDLKTIGGKDWYAWASDVLLKAQHPDGSWEDLSNNPVNKSVDTCFALLVLKRVNVAKDLTANIKKVINIKDLEGP